ncbi:MAG: S8 family peptidase [Sphingobium sp.]
MTAAMIALTTLSACGGGSAVNSSSGTTPTNPGNSNNSGLLSPSTTPSALNFNTAEYSNSNAASASKAISAWQAGANGQGVTIGLVDTGIDTTSAEFSGRISSSSAAFGGNSSYQDSDGHGTAVAGIAAAARNNSEIMGIAYGASVMALRTDVVGSCAGSGGCSFSDTAIAAALNHAASNGASVVNISLGGAGSISPSLRQAVDSATKAGVIIVVSAGNERAKALPSYDPSSPSPFALDMLSAGNGLVIIVNSVDANGQISNFSDLAGTSQNNVIGALGEQVRSLDLLNDPTTYYVYSGTSFSAPQVTAAVALMKQAFPTLTSAQIVSRLLSTARDTGAAGTDSIYGRGILDIAAAFAPFSITTLAGSSTAVSMNNNGALSTAMGDAQATGSGTQVVILDALGRAYSLGLQSSLRRAPSRAPLYALSQTPRHTARLSLGSLDASLRYASIIPVTDRFGERHDITRPHQLVGEARVALSSDTMLALAFGKTEGSAESAVTETDFLAAPDTGQDTGFIRQADMAFTLRHRLSSHSGLAMTGVRGTILGSGLHAGYRHVGAQFSWQSTGLKLLLGGQALHEDETLLGSKLAPFFGIAGSHTLFADARADIALSEKWSLELVARRGWTGASGVGNAHLNTMAWSASLSRTGLMPSGRDRIALRVSQPLRVVSGGVDAVLPVSYDYTTLRADWRTTVVNLAPKGRETDAELSYTLPAASGWLSLSGYARRQPGHIAYAPSDIGAAMRFSIGY